MITQLRRIGSPASNLLLLGLCFPQAWMFAISQRVVFDSLAFQLAFHLGMLAGLVAVALLFRPGASEDRTPLLFHPLSVIALCLVPLLGLAPATLPDAVQIVAGAGAGSGIAFCFAAWFLIYGSMATKDAFGFVLLGFSAGALLCLALGAIARWSAVLVIVALCALPLCSLAASRAAWRSSSGLLANRPATGQAGARRSPASNAALVAQVVIYAVIFGNGIVFSILQGAIPNSPHEHVITLVNYALRAVLPFLLFLWLSAQGDDGRARSLVNALLLALAFLLLLLWFVADIASAIAYVSLSLARNLVLVLLYLVLIKLAQRSSSHPCFVFAAGRGAYEVSVSIGIAAYSALVASVGALPIEEHIVQATAICVFIFLASCFFMTAQNLSDAPRTASFPLPEPDDGCKAVAREFSLSEREREIMELFYRGHTKKGIADILVLSENTVRWYTKQLYAKLDVHSKEELICLVNDRMPEK